MTWRDVIASKNQYMPSSLSPGPPPRIRFGSSPDFGSGGLKFGGDGCVICDRLNDVASATYLQRFSTDQGASCPVMNDHQRANAACCKR
jgi:hypothetical protein